MAVDTNVIYNNFSYGTVSERMRRRVDMEFYQNSARLMENLLPLQTGGFVLRPGTEVVASLSAYATRLVPFVISSKEYYLVSLAPKELILWKPSIAGDGTWTTVDVSYYKPSVEKPTVGEVFEYDTSSKIKKIQYTQDNAHLILCSRDYAPVILEKLEGGGFSLHPLELEKKTAKRELQSDGSYKAEEFNYDKLFAEEGKYPGTCAFCANRLWLGSTTGKPYKLWASRPFEYNNFQDYEWYSYLDETITTEQYLTALKGSGESKEINSDGSYVKISVEVSPNGYVVESRQKYTPEGEPDGKPVIKTYYYSKPATKWEKTITADCAMIFETGSDRDERIEWINAYDNIIIGTASSEWLIPWNIDALNPSIKKIASYGADADKNSVAGGTGIFYPQSGGKRIRGMQSSPNGMSFLDMNYLCPELLSKGIRELHWQRVPIQRLYVVLNDGSIAVLCYEPNYGINAWVTWKFDLPVQSLSIIDTEDGQDVFILLKRDKECTMERFNWELFTDHVAKGSLQYTTKDFVGIMESNGIDDERTIAIHKTAYSIYADSLGTDFRAGIIGSSMKDCKNKQKHDLELVDTFSPNTYDELRVRIESYPGKPLTILAVKATVGLGR